ncbi:FadR family transcriptional regulator [Desulfovibrio sp. OttesenSCG-928-I05]|nr:FadR family transcriptional regulator [Desulfovibrio sp. OttesenSCG-928-I05]
MRLDELVPFPTKKRRDIIYEKLEELIESGHWKPGEQLLTEKELSERFNAGRSTVRAALERLRNRGLIESCPGRGTFVKSQPVVSPELFDSSLPETFTKEELLQIMDFRFCVEPVIASLATQYATRQEIERLRELTDTMKNNPMQGSELYAENDLRFHILLAEISRNDLFLTAMKAVKPLMAKQHVITSSVPEMRPMGPRYHYQLIEALEERLPRKAEAVMRAHIDETYHYIKKIPL